MMSGKKIEGIYFERKTMVRGTGHTMREDVNDIHYHVKTDANGQVALGVINFEGKPTGLVAETISFQDFKKRFKSCSHHDCHFQLIGMDPQLRKLEEKAMKGREHLRKQDYSKAEAEFRSALEGDEGHLKAAYGLGKTYLEKGEPEKAGEIFEKLSRNEALFSKENLRVFKEFGVDLRKGKMYSLAVQNYRKAIQLHPEDAALYFGLARVYGKTQEYDKAVKCLRKCLSLKPDHSKASEYLDHIQQKQE